MQQTLWILLLCATLNAGASVQTAVPPCMSHGQSLPINNDQVIMWKSSTANGYLERAHVHGTLQKIYPDRTGHHHLEILMESTRPDTIEVIYNESFGTTAPYRVGSIVEACGDYVTSRPGDPHGTSPDGAIIHWLHRSPHPDHESGYLVIDGIVAGGN